MQYRISKDLLVLLEGIQGEPKFASRESVLPLMVAENVL